MRHSFLVKQASLRTAALLGAAVFLLASAAPAAVPAQAAAGPDFFKGQVRDLSGSAAALQNRFEAAVKAADQSFFAAAVFPASDRIRYGRRDGSDLYTIGAGASRIKIREKHNGGLTISDGDGDERKPAPAVWLLLCDGKTGRVVDTAVLDPDRTYECDDTPVFWLGKTGAAESLGFLEKIFLSHPDDDVREKMLFVLSRHDDPRVFDLLYRSALKDKAGDVRHQAVFWMGTLSDGRALTALKDIFRESGGDAGLREQIVFALSLRKEKEAVVEMIRIAREERDDSVREKAVFWLGQKASAESVKALKDIISEPTEEDKIKEQAVFAVSQLPKEKSVPLLLDIARNHKNPSVRKKAIFWLGQTDDPAALKLFEEILLKR